ncbi:RHS repeat-associated core domain-containing protein [Paenibacillus sp. IHB B 3084]|uniref:RHS repeat-associated core domain-containing protein n=1 Tax=Paenibacillus sp. IHB B 3084 TaxID=867076 RepID=UPI001CB9045C|nr:RHS repeat-associated core domain-containing protein [Paenibacillus sp. IHB B 3084]
MTDGQGTTSYAYDPADGSLTGLKYPDGTQISYEYNKQSRTGYVLTDASGASMHVQSKLDSLGRVTQMDISSGAGTANIQSLTGASAASGGSLDRMTFDYAPNGLLKGQSSSRGLSTRFSYNGLDLSGVTVEQGGTALHQFGYERDANKNIIGRTQNGTTDQFGYDPLNRIASEAAGEKNKTYGYDPNGNRSAEGSGKVFGMKNAEYTYDSVSRLTKVSGEGKEVGYSYNGDGLLYERTEGGKTTRYYYNEEAKLMAEAEVEGETPKITYVYVYDLSGQLWARQDKASGQLQYYQLNGHGDVVGLSDSTGKELNSYSYDIWGGPETVKETVPNVLRYAGEYWDDTTGLQYLRARWYDPGTARFMGEDTYQGEMSDPRSLNGYAYVANNPLIYIDPSGHYFETLDYQELRILLNEARVKSSSSKNQDYQLYKDFIRKRYDFSSVFGGANQYNYLYDLLTGTSGYKNSAGKSDWARGQLLSAYQKWTDAEVLGIAAMGMIGNTGGKSVKGRTTGFTKISFKTDLFNRYQKHVFSTDHIKDGIMKLGKDKQSIFSSITGKIGSVDPSKLKQGSNQMHTKINGYDVTIRFYVENGAVINVNTFMGTADRVIGNLIK